MTFQEEHLSEKEIHIQSLGSESVSDAFHYRSKSYCSQMRKNKTRENQTDTKAWNTHILASRGVTVKNVSFTLRQADTGERRGQDSRFNRIPVTAVL